MMCSRAATGGGLRIWQRILALARSTNDDPELRRFTLQVRRSGRRRRALALALAAGACIQKTQLWRCTLHNSEIQVYKNTSPTPTR